MYSSSRIFLQPDDSLSCEGTTFSTVSNTFVNLRRHDVAPHHWYLLLGPPPRLSTFRLDILLPYTQATPCSGNSNFYTPCVLGGIHSLRCPCDSHAPLYQQPLFLLLSPLDPQPPCVNIRSVSLNGSFESHRL
jgi:hypothetical protein